MITGVVSDRRAHVSLSVRGPKGDEAAVAFRLDTGFTATITLPPDIATALKLPFLRSQSAGVAGGNRLLMDVHEATLLWDGRERRVEVLVAGNVPLLGMALLDGHEVRLEVIEGGGITIEALQRREGA